MLPYFSISKQKIIYFPVEIWKRDWKTYGLIYSYKSQWNWRVGR